MERRLTADEKGSMSNAWQDGYFAQGEGIDIDRNPYDAMTQWMSCQEWVAGWQYREEEKG